MSVKVMAGKRKGSNNEFLSGRIALTDIHKLRKTVESFRVAFAFMPSGIELCRRADGTRKDSPNG